MYVELMKAEEVKEYIAERNRKNQLLHDIVTHDLVDNLTTKSIAELYQDAVNCLHCLLYEYCECDYNKCMETIKKYIEKGVKGLNDNITK
jgi:hypothetical protein